MVFPTFVGANFWAIASYLAHLFKIIFKALATRRVRVYIELNN